MASWIGSTLRRPEGPDKVRGSARYVADLEVEGAWVGGTVRAGVARGWLSGLERDPGFDFSRVAVVEAYEIPGDNVVALKDDDQPVLAEDEIEHWGEPVALVAAPDSATLAGALAAIRARVVPREPVLDFEASERAFREIEIVKGDPGAAFERAALAGARVIRGVYRSDSQEQMYIEPQGVIAYPPDAAGAVLVVGSLQCPYYVHKALCRALALPPEKARVVQAATGGGFGGKEEYPSVLACHAALLARKCKRPVRMIYDRHEDLAVTPKRHPSRVGHRTAVDGSGRLLAMEVEVLLDGGAYSTLSPVVLSRACIHAAGPYRCDHVRIRGRAVATNHVPYGAFRGFGAPQVCFAVERQMDRIARELSIHPAEIRRRNLLRAGDTTATSQKLASSVGAEEVLERALAKSRFDRQRWRGRKIGRVRRGVGLSLFFHGAGFTGSGEALLRARVDVELDSTGRAIVRTSQSEFGQGTFTLLRAIAAEALGAAPDDVVVADVDTGAVPNSGPTVASRTCMIVGGIVAKACRELAARVGWGDAPFRERARAFVALGGERRASVTYASPPGLAWDDERYRGDAYPAYGWAADVAEVEVDLATFEVRVTRFLSAVDVGRAIQPQMVEGQIEGGSLQAVGFAHLEVVATKDGRCLQDRMATCIIPTTLDAPPFEVELVEIPFEHGPFGAKGVGELPMDGGAPAVASAIEDALGIHVERLPATPERLMELWLAAHPEERL